MKTGKGASDPMTAVATVLLSMFFAAAISVASVVAFDFPNNVRSFTDSETVTDSATMREMLVSEVQECASDTVLLGADEGELEAFRDEIHHLPAPSLVAMLGDMGCNDIEEN